MPVTYTNRKGLTYSLYGGETKTGKPRYYFSRTGQGQGEPVSEIPPGFTIRESVNGLVSLVKDLPPLIQPEEVATIEKAIKQHPEGRLYRISVKPNMIEIYEQITPGYEAMINTIKQTSGKVDPELAKRFRYEEERYAHFTPMLRFVLLNPTQRLFGVKRVYYYEDGWKDLRRTGSLAGLAKEFIPTLGTDEFFDL